MKIKVHTLHFELQLSNEICVAIPVCHWLILFVFGRYESSSTIPGNTPC